MKSLPNLSTELLLTIISNLPIASYPPLSLTNRRLHQIANPRLYRSIYFWGTGNKDIKQRNFEHGECGELFDCQKAPIGASRVYDLDTLTETLQSYPELAFHVRKVELIWDADKEVEDEGRVLRFLDITKCMQLETLILAPPSLYFHVPAYARVTTLRTRHKGHYGGLDKDVAPDIDQLYKQCCIPSLDEISVHGWLYWSESVMDATRSSAVRANIAPNAPLPRARTSSVTVMRVSTLGTPGYIFTNILSWPKALRVFHFECEPYIGWGSQYQGPGRLSSEDFIKPLEQCRCTLEELSIRCSVGSNDGAASTSRPINLRTFPNLKRLCIRHDFLLMSRSWRKYSHLNLNYDGPPPRVSEVLPPSLEQLHLEIGEDEFRMYEDDWHAKPSEDVYWFLDTLEELAMRKAEYLPHLTTVVSGESPSFDYDYYFWDIVNGCERGAQVKAAFAREKVQFSCWVSDEEPRTFDDRIR